MIDSYHQKQEESAMDLVRIGKFLSQLRREKELTQEELGERLGVTNKTVSRWENGNYLPPVEILQLLSEIYGLTINELLSAERLNDAEFRKKAEENIKSALTFGAYSFTNREKHQYFRRKWGKAQGRFLSRTFRPHSRVYLHRLR